ncbi:MAG TPA: hypothetical protein VF778_02215, partial [Xanthobacteraceae bacterium]
MPRCGWRYGVGGAPGCRFDRGASTVDACNPSIVPVLAKAALMKTFIKDAKWGRFILMGGDLISRYMNEFGEWSETEIDLFRFILPNSIEVGANMGTHTVPLSKICMNGRIFCFE